MRIIKKILNNMFNVMAADTSRDKEVEKNAARYGLATGATNAGTGWRAGLEEKDIKEAVADINDGLAKSGAHFKVTGLGVPKK